MVFQLGCMSMCFFQTQSLSHSHTIIFIFLNSLWGGVRGVDKTGEKMNTQKGKRDALVTQPVTSGFSYVQIITSS